MTISVSAEVEETVYFDYSLKSVTSRNPDSSQFGCRNQEIEDVSYQIEPTDD